MTTSRPLVFKRPLFRAYQRGVTLVELLIAMAVALIVVLAATAAFMTSKQLFTTDAEAQELQDSVRFGSYVVKSLIRQAGYSDYAPDHMDTNGVGFAEIASNAKLLAGSTDPYDLNVIGASNTKVTGGESYGSDDSGGLNGSDSLLLRFFGRTKADDTTGLVADGSIINCAGVAQHAPITLTAPSRSWSFFYISDSGGEPELMCKFRDDIKGVFTVWPLVRGVEVFKVRYGYDTDDDSVPNLWLSAKQINDKAPTAVEANKEWRKIVSVRVGMVVRSARAGAGPRQIGGSTDYRLFPLGAEFSDDYFDPPDDGRFRRVATFTVMLRNVVKDTS